MSYFKLQFYKDSKWNDCIGHTCYLDKAQAFEALVGFVQQKLAADLYQDINQFRIACVSEEIIYTTWILNK